MFGAPMARDVMVAYFDKKARLAEAELLKRSPGAVLASALAPVPATPAGSPLAPAAVVPAAAVPTP
jgi:hypothetical protein